MRKFLLTMLTCAVSTLAAAVEISGNNWSAKCDPALTADDAKRISQDGKMPEGALTFKLEKDVRDLRNVFGGKRRYDYRTDRAIVYAEILSDADKVQAVGIGCDWWLTCFVNGEMFYTTEPDGNHYYPIHVLNHVAKIKLRKGVNRIAFLVRPGEASWMFAFRFLPDLTNWYDNYEDNVKLFKKAFPDPQPFKLRHKVYLTHLTPDGVQFNAEFGARTALCAKIFENGEAVKTVWNMEYGMKTAREFHQFRVDGLKPDTEYTYELARLNTATTKTVKVAEGKFRTYPAAGLDHKLVLISDTQVLDEKRKKAILDAKAMVPEARAFVHLGDLSNSMDDVEKRLFKNMLDPLNGMPFVAVRGNHEFRGDETDDYVKYFGRPYGAFRIGDVLYIYLDTGEDKPLVNKPNHYTLRTDTEEHFREQGKWLKELIKSDMCKTAKRRIVLTHCTPFLFSSVYFRKQLDLITDGAFFGENPECPVDLWICGHTHSPYRYDPVTGKIHGAGAGRKVSGEDAATIKFPVYVNDGPGGLGVNLSALELVNDKDGIMLIMRDMDSKRVMDHIRIVRGKPIEAISTEFVDTEWVRPVKNKKKNKKK